MLVSQQADSKQARMSAGSNHVCKDNAGVCSTGSNHVCKDNAGV
jgi:hypothetical protein